MEFKLIRSRRSSVSIRVNNDGVTVKAPTGAPLALIEDFVNEKLPWIRKRLTEIENVKRSLDGMYVDKVPYLGESYGLEIRPANLREKIFFDDEKFVAHLRPSSKSAEKVYTSWLRKRASQVFVERVGFYKNILGVKPGRISIRSQRRRWGSASAEGSLNFNLNLLKAPMAIVDYVVVHELCHLKVYNHSKRFWKLVESVIPDFREKRLWLKRNGLSLTAKA